MPLIWVIGATGQVGKVLLQALAKKSWQVHGFSRQKLDLMHHSQIMQCFQQRIPTCVINLGAYTAVDKAEVEPESAFAVNAYGVESLAKQCAQYAVPLIHLSTDYVFSGTEIKPYQEFCITNPLSTYGKSKALGEELLKANHEYHIILRTSWIFSDATQSFPSIILNKGVQLRQLSVVSDQIGCPTAASHLAEVLCQLTAAVLDKKALYGTYHYRDDEIHSWFTFTKIMLEMAANIDSRWSDIRLDPIRTSDYPSKATRPEYSVLNIDKIAKDYGIYPMSCTRALEQTVREIVKQSAMQWRM